MTGVLHRFNGAWVVPGVDEMTIATSSVHTTVRARVDTEDGDRPLTYTPIGERQSQQLVNTSPDAALHRFVLTCVCHYTITRVMHWQFPCVQCMLGCWVLVRCVSYIFL